MASKGGASPDAADAGGAAPVPNHFGGLDPAEDVPPGVNGMLVRSLGWVQLPEEKEKMVGDVASALDSLGVKYEVVKGELSDVVWVGQPPSISEGLGENGGADNGGAERSSSSAAGGASVGASVGAAAGAPPPSSSAVASNGGSYATPDGGAANLDGDGGVAVGASGIGAASPNRGVPEGQLCVRLRVVPDGDDAQSALHIDRQAGDVLQFHAFYRDVRNQLAGANGWVNNQGRYEHDVYAEAK